MRSQFPLLVLVACAGEGGEVVVPASAVTALEISPTSTTVNTSPDEAATVQYLATATFEDGTRAEIDLVSWSLSNFAAGTIDADGLFTASTENGAITTVVAEHAGVSAEAELTVVYGDVIDESDGAASVDDFAGAATGVVQWLYPPDGVAVPRNIPSLSFMWEPLSGATAYRLSFTTAITTVYLITTETTATVDGATWQTIAATNAGGEVAVEVRALAGDALAASATRSVTVNRLDAFGSIYYWSTSDAGIVKVPIDAVEPELYYAPNLNAPNCVACHVVREDRMGVAYGIEGELKFYTGIVDISGSEPVELTTRDRVGYYSTLDPDGKKMLTSDETGVLSLWDATTGAFVRQTSVADTILTQPDWSPDGTQIVAVAAKQMYGDCCFVEGKLVLVPIDDDGNLGAITTLYEPEYDYANTLNVYYPSFSPDGKWVAFNMAKGSGYDNAEAALYVISASGGEPIELAAANQGAGLTNSWPHWGPLPDDEVFWLAFASKRTYGNLVNYGEDDPMAWQSQIWVTAFRPATAEQGLDPSAPAFWLPNQDAVTSNHTTYWGP